MILKMKRKIFNYFKIAAKLAEKKNEYDRRSFLLGAIAIRNDGAAVSATNGSSELPNRHAHAEKRVCSMIDSGSTIFVARVRIGDGTLAMARPCRSCMKALVSRRVKRIYYSISDNEYGVINIRYKSSIKKYERVKMLKKNIF